MGLFSEIEDGVSIDCILSKQENPDTKKRFKNIKAGDHLKLKPLDELRKLDLDCLINSSWCDSMYTVGMNNIVFDPSKWGHDGSMYCKDWNWSLDMYDYDKPYQVELL